MKVLWAEFKAFALGGNMLDLALGFIIGTAFAGLVNSLAADVIMQFAAALFGQPDFSDLLFTLNGSQIRYGKFLTGIINFLLLAAVLFTMVKVLKHLGLSSYGAKADTRKCPFCTEPVPIAASKCRWCTADIEPATPAP
jgi:large conductance mechanosensitive channel